jgi:hypothetical protein
LGKTCQIYCHKLQRCPIKGKIRKIVDFWILGISYPYVNNFLFRNYFFELGLAYSWCGVGID